MRNLLLAILVAASFGINSCSTSNAQNSPQLNVHLLTGTIVKVGDTLIVVQADNYNVYLVKFIKNKNQ